MKGRLFVISGPSGAGKSTLIQVLRNTVEGLAYSVSHTTRRPRAGEADGVHYHFVSRAVFERMIGEGAFVEWARVYGDLYGTAFSGIDAQLAAGVEVVLDVDAQGADNIRERYGSDSVLVYVLPPSLDVLGQRLKERGTDAAAVAERRLAEAQQEIEQCTRYDFLILNEELSRAVDELRAVVVSDRCRSARRMPGIEGRFPEVFG